MADLSLNEEYIARGGHWNVYKYHTTLQIRDVNYENPIGKITRKGTLHLYEHSTKIYNIIKQIGIPTISFCLVEELNGKRVLLCEDLNQNELVYVSPNTIRGCVAEDKIEIYKLLNMYNEDNTCIPSKAEKYCLENKISGIANFSHFVNDIKSDMINAAKHHIGMCEDAFFFGREPETENVTLKYKLADFDNVVQCCEDEDVKNANIQVALSAIWEYIQFFMSNNSQKIEYQSFLTDEIKKFK